MWYCATGIWSHSCWVYLTKHIMTSSQIKLKFQCKRFYGGESSFSFLGILQAIYKSKWFLKKHQIYNLISVVGRSSQTRGGEWNIMTIHCSALRWWLNIVLWHSFNALWWLNMGEYTSKPLERRWQCVRELGRIGPYVMKEGLFAHGNISWAT